MKRANVLGAALLAVTAAAYSVPAQAQVTLGADAAFVSRYDWRGLTLGSEFAIEPDVYLTVPAGPGSITAGVWGNIEPSQYDGSDDISEGGGQSSFDLTEYDVWLEYAQTVGSVDFTLGGVGYLYPNPDNPNPPAVGLLTNDGSKTLELYGNISHSDILSPKFALWYDVGKINGAYMEGSISPSYEVSPNLSVGFGALVGLSAGQGINDDPNSDDVANFEDDGITHVDLSANASITAGAVSFTPQVHVIFGVDEFTKFRTANKSSDAKVWAGVTLSWYKDYGGAEEEAEEAAE